MSSESFTAGKSRRWITPAVAALLVLGLAACAPEPVAGQGGKNADPEQHEGSWGQPDDEAANTRQTELPESFPTDQFPLPRGAVVYDTGERGEGIWFVVLLAADEPESLRLWDDVIRLGGFQISEEVETSEGGQAATLTSTTLRVTALTVPQTDGAVQLSYSLTRIV